MILFVVLIFFLIMWFVCYVVHKKDLSNPNIIVCSVWIFSILCAFYNYSNWRIDYGVGTALIIVSALMLFFVIGFTTSKVFKRIEFRAEPQYIKVRRIVVLVVCIVSVVLMVYQIVNTFRSIVYYGMSTMGENMYEYRLDNETNSSFVLNQLIKVVKCFAYIFTYIAINNIYISRKIKGNYRYFIPGMCFAVISLCAANRTGVLEYVFAILILIYFMMSRSNRKNRNSKFIKRAILIIVGFFAFFCIIRPFVGRLNTDDPLTYITKYSGGSVELFDMFVKDPIRSDGIGQTTFRSLYENLDKVGLVEYVDKGIEFRRANGILIGNVYTSLRKPLQDFGVIGVLLLQIVLSIVYQLWYGYSRNRFYKYNNPRTLLFMLMCIGPIFLHSISETFFSAYICLNTVIVYVVYRICYYGIFVYGGENEKTS